MDLIVAALGALMGAAGVASAAAAAHASADPRLATMAQMLMTHAAAIIGLVALSRSAASQSLLWAACLMALGIALFCGDLAARHWLGGRLFPFAAPIGGSITILAWGLAACAAVWTLFRR